MRSLALPSFVLGWFLLGGCTKSDPFDDVSSAAEADRGALKKCLDAPDLPGNQWPKDAAKARCWLSLPQDPSLAEIDALLHKPDGARELDGRYAKILAGHYADPLHRGSLYRAYQDFQTPEGRRIAADWLAKSSGSPYARLAMGEASLGAAWKARGNAYAADVTPEQARAYTKQLKTAIPLLLLALKNEPRLSPACADLMEVGEMISDQDVHVAAARHCAAVDPLAWNVNEMLLRSVDPRWGGSFDAIDREVERVRVRAKDNPILASLLAKGIARRAYFPVSDDVRMAPAVADLQRAAMAAPDPFYIDKAGKAIAQEGNLQKAEVYVQQALRFAPDEPEFLIDRAQLYVLRHGLAHAIADARHAQKQPDEGNFATWHTKLAVVFRDALDPADERIELQKVIDGPDQPHRLWAFTTLCQTWIGPQYDGHEAAACTKQLVDRFPDDAQANYLRALSLYIVHDPSAADYDARFRKLADPKGEGYAGEVQQLEILAKQAAGGT